jgi:deoxyribonuclease V
MITHEWDITPAEAIRVQKELAPLVRQSELVGEVRHIAGCDCAFTADGRIIAVAVLFQADTREPIAREAVVQPATFPYVPGLLSFREAPAILAAIGKLRPRPDLVLCDGQGIAHPRGLGLASHVGLWLDLPTIGVAKSRLCGEHRQPGRRKGCKTQLKLDGQVVGAVLRTRDDVKPLYISPGHKITLDQSVRWTLRTTDRYRLPEPTRQADRLVSQQKRELSKR